MGGHEVGMFKKLCRGVDLEWVLYSTNGEAGWRKWFLRPADGIITSWSRDVSGYTEFYRWHIFVVPRLQNFTKNK